MFMNGVTVVRKNKSEDQTRIHYILERPYMVTFWSITLFLICLVVIISLEVGRPTILSVLFGIIAFCLVMIAFYRQLRVNTNTIEVYHLFKKRRLIFNMDTTLSITLMSHAIILKNNNQVKKIYLTKKEMEAFKKVAKQHELQMIEGRD